ncbi:hypothetical protein [Bulleidia sp. zg-1006]|nr:hypothetical protein [Bulleidia sp. zg-1006]
MLRRSECFFNKGHQAHAEEQLMSAETLKLIAEEEIAFTEG